MPKEALAGTLVNWIDVGEGPPTLLIHCALGRAGAWVPLMAGLKNRRLVAFDLPGHGQSDALARGRDMHTATLEIAQALIARVGAPVDVIGHSFGGTVALRLALEAPSEVRSLALVEPVLFAAVREAAPEALAVYDREREEETRAFAAGDWERAARHFHVNWGSRQNWERLSSEYRRYMLDRIAIIPEMEPALYEDCFGLVPRLGQIKVPALLISGSESPPIVAAIQEALADRMLRAQRMIVGGASHMVPLSHPAPVAAAIGSFLDYVARGAAVQPPSGSIK